MTRFALATLPPSSAHAASAAIAIIDLTGDLATLPIDLPPVGGVRLLSIPDIDDLLITRPAQHHIQLQPHAGPAILGKLARWLIGHGAHPASAPIDDDRLAYWLAHAPSPLALDILLEQPRLRRQHTPPTADPRLNRLLIPPIVAAVGVPNIGKSSLLNTLARNSVAVVSDHPGTTRDAVGVYLNLAGLVVRWLDLPGLRTTTDPIEQQAILRARHWLNLADLVLHCQDAASPSPIHDLPAERPTLTIHTRADLVPSSARPALACSAHTGEGIAELATAIRDHLVTPAALTPSPLWDLPPIPTH